MFKVDFKKAYDNVDGVFLDYVLLKQRYGEMGKVDSRLCPLFHFMSLLMVDLEVNLKV